MFVIVSVVFGILCTYYFINVFTNKGNMSNIEFIFAVFLLIGILAYIYLNGQTEAFSQQKPDTKKIREKVVDFYRKGSDTAKTMYLKHKPAFIRFYKDVQKKIGEKFLK